MNRKPPIFDGLLTHARHMRRESTDAEQALWRVIRGRRLAGFKFRRQHPVGPYILDFYCEEASLAVELDGGQHSEPENAKYDAERTAWLQSRGIRILRFWNHDALKHPEVIQRNIHAALSADGVSTSSDARPHPDPLPAGEGKDQQV